MSHPPTPPPLQSVIAIRDSDPEGTVLLTIVAGSLPIDKPRTSAWGVLLPASIQAENQTRFPARKKISLGQSNIFKSRTVK